MSWDHDPMRIDPEAPGLIEILRGAEGKVSREFVITVLVIVGVLALVAALQILAA